MYSLKKFKHLDNNYMLVQLDDKVKNNFLSSFLIGIDNKFLKLDIADLNESTDYYKNKLNDKVVKKFAGKKFNKLNKKHLTYLADLCKMNLVIFDLDNLDLKFSTDLNKKNKTVYLFKHGKKEYLLMKQNMRGMVSKLPVGIYEQFGGMPGGSTVFNPNWPDSDPLLLKKTAEPATTVAAAPALKASNIYKYNLVEPIALIQIADIINSLYDHSNKDSKSSPNETIDNYNDIDEYNNTEDNPTTNESKNVSFEEFNIGKDVVIQDNQQGGNEIDYEKEDFIHDFGKSRGEFKLAWNRFFNENKKTTVNFGGITLNENVNEDEILSNAILDLSEEKTPFEFNSDLSTIFQEYNNKGLKTKSLSSKIKAIFNNDGKPNNGFDALINLSKQVYYKLNADNYKFLQFDQGDTQKILEVPRNNNLSNNIGITILRNIPYLIDGSGSDSISERVENERWKNNNYEDKYEKMFAEEECLSILTKMDISNIEYYQNENGKYTFKIKKIDNDVPFDFSKGFTVNNLLVVMLCVILDINLDDNIEIIETNLLKQIQTRKRKINSNPNKDKKDFITLFDKNKDSIKQIIDFINTYDNNNKELRLKVLRLLKFIGDRFQALSVVNDNYDYNNEAPYLLSRSILGTGDRVLIAYALKNNIPTIYVSKNNLYLNLPVLITVNDFKGIGKYKRLLNEQNFIPNRNPVDDKSYPTDEFFNDDKSLEQIKFDLCIRLFKNKIDTDTLFLEGLQVKDTVDRPILEENEKRSIYIDILSDLTKDISDNSDITFIPILLEYIEEIEGQYFNKSFSNILIYILNDKIFSNSSKHTPGVSYNISNMRNLKKYINDNFNNFEMPYNERKPLLPAYIYNEKVNVIEESSDFKNYRIKLDQYGTSPGKNAERAYSVTTYIKFIDQLIANVNNEIKEKEDFFNNEKEKLIELKQKAQEDINYHKKIQDKLEECFNGNNDAKIIFNKSRIVDYFKELHNDENEVSENKELYKIILRNLKENESMDEN